jgi:hypothetical protein
MRTPFRVLLVLAAGFLALPALAQQGVAGRWNASVDTEFGPFAFVFEFIVDAAGKLTGAMHNELIGAAPIKDAVVDGDNLSFKLTFEGGPDGPMTISYSGTVKGDELALTSKFEGAPPGGGPAEQSFTAKRAQ